MDVLVAYYSNLPSYPSSPATKQGHVSIRRLCYGKVLLIIILMAAALQL